MNRALGTMIGASATYGFSIGAVHSWLYATRNLLKFPLLLLCTGAVCALAYFVLARFFGTPLSFRRVQGLVLEIFRDLAVLLASLAPVTLFLALSLQEPVGEDLGEYPFFQGLNVIAIALCGCLAVARQATALRTDYRLQGRLIVPLLTGWMALSLFAGGQCAWYLRPFFGIASRIDNNPPFCMGTAPDFRGARSFYEAVYNLVDPPRSH
jgi:hypothetical protein